MGRQEWEGGEITVPRDQWASFRKELLRTWNEWQEQRLLAAKEAHQYCKDALKRVRGDEKRHMAVHEAYRAWCDLNRDRQIDSIFTLVFTYDADAGKHVLSRTAPQKKALPLRKLGGGGSISYGGGLSITLTNDTRIAKYSVSESKSACERARQHLITKKFFSLLGGLTWKRGTGGCIVGNDEYNREARFDGGGGNYVIERFGPLGKPEPLKLGGRRQT